MVIYVKQVVVLDVGLLRPQHIITCPMYLKLLYYYLTSERPVQSCSF